MKSAVGKKYAAGYGSPPARGAWIEIHYRDHGSIYAAVAPREGGVD